MGAGELFETPAKEAAEVPAGTWDGWAHALLLSISQGGVVRVDRLTHLLGGGVPVYQPFWCPLRLKPTPGSPCEFGDGNSCRSNHVFGKSMDPQNTRIPHVEALRGGAVVSNPSAGCFPAGPAGKRSVDIF